MPTSPERPRKPCAGRATTATRLCSTSAVCLESERRPWVAFLPEPKRSRFGGKITCGFPADAAQISPYSGCLAAEGFFRSSFVRPCVARLDRLHPRKMSLWCSQQPAIFFFPFFPFFTKEVCSREKILIGSHVKNILIRSGVASEKRRSQTGRRSNTDAYRDDILLVSCSCRRAREQYYSKHCNSHIIACYIQKSD